MESPFKFLDSYTREDHDIFFGRDQEVEEVYNKIFQGKTLFVYGESGTGKSSLINCGLANKFKDTDWLPVNIRRGNNINESLLNELNRLSLTEVKNLNGSFSKNLFKYTRSLYLDFFKPIYFIFDQFEELYLLGTKDEWKEFISGIKALAEKDLQVHFIFVIRAEYLHFMTEFEEELPDIFSNKLRIEKITRIKAKECIEGPAKVYGIELDEGFSDMLFDQLSPDRNEIELTYLQVFLDRIYKKALQNSENEILYFSKSLLENIGMVSDVLSDFLDEQIDALGDKDSTLSVLKSFVTVEGTKRQASIDDIVNFSKSIGQPVTEMTANEKVGSLLTRRILKELPDSNQYELRHDALAGKIFEKITLRERELIEVRQFLDYGLAEYQKRGFLLNDQDLAYIKPHLDILDLSGELKEFVEESIKSASKKKRFRKRVIAIIIIILALTITSLWGFFYAQRQKRDAIGQKDLAEQNAMEAQKQKELAEQNEQLAIFSKRQAEENAEEAKTQAQIAQEQKTLAELQRLQADSNRKDAEYQRQVALLEKDSAESARAKALSYLNQANMERERAERLSMQSLARSIGIKSAQLPDLEVKSLLALQAYKFNLEFGGYQFQADIYDGLYEAYKQSIGSDFNVYKGHNAAVTEISEIGDVVLTTSSDGQILKWKSDLSGFAILNNTAMINNTMHVSPDKSKIAVGTSKSAIFILNTRSGEIISRYNGHDGEVWDVLFVNNQTLVSSGKDKKIYSWDITSGNKTELASFDSDVHALEYNLDRNKLIIGQENGKLIELTLATSSTKQVSNYKGEMITCLVLNHEKTLIAIGFESGTMQLLNADNYDIIETLPGHTAAIADIKFSNDDKFLISGGYDRKSFIRNMEELSEPPISITDHESFVWAVGFLPSMKETITGELNGSMKRYSINLSTYANEMCQIASRNLSSKEWKTFIGDNIPYRETCK